MDHMVIVRISYGSIALFWSILHNVFLLYYVEMFVSVYKIDKTSFWIGEVSGNKSTSNSRLSYRFKG